ncbi:MAG: anti-sigma factor antagonist [Actinomycetota bacterium]|jgi:anti-anti-sigma factor
MPGAFSLDAQQQGRFLRVIIHGELDVATTPALCEEVERALAKGALEVLIDCRGMEFIDSNGVGALLDLRTQLSDLGGLLILFGPTGRVAQTLEVTGLDREFHVVAAPE